MTDEQALLAAVLSNPDEDTPRLVLADWWDDHGQHDRAEFCRTQIKLATLPPCDSHCRDRIDYRCEGCEQGEHLRVRERELLARNLNAMSPTGLSYSAGDGHTFTYGFRWPRDGGASIPNPVIVRRGFVEEITCTLADFAGGECGRCGGRGVYAQQRGLLAFEPRECPTCSGTGRTAGAAGGLFAAHPVSRVRLTDKFPFRYDGSTLRVWYRESGDPRRTHAEQSRLPDELFDALEGWCEGGIREGRWKTYDGEDAANEALSTACVTFGRHLAGLPRSPAPAGV